MAQVKLAVGSCALHSRISYSCSWTAARRKGKKREFGPTQSALLRGDTGARGAQEGTSVAELNLSLKLKVRYWRSHVKLKILKEIEIPTVGCLSSLFVYILLHRKCMNINKTNSKSNIFIKPTLPTLWKQIWSSWDQYYNIKKQTNKQTTHPGTQQHLSGHLLCYPLQFKTFHLTNRTLKWPHQKPLYALDGALIREFAILSDFMTVKWGSLCSVQLKLANQQLELLLKLPTN